MAPHELNQDIRIAVRTSPEVLERFEALKAKLISAGVKFRGRKLTAEATASAILLWFLELPLERQIGLASASVPRFEMNLAGVALDEMPRSTAILPPYQPGEPPIGESPAVASVPEMRRRKHKRRA